jgi:hypothetical protein
MPWKSLEYSGQVKGHPGSKLLPKHVSTVSIKSHDWKSESSMSARNSFAPDDASVSSLVPAKECADGEIFAAQGLVKESPRSTLLAVAPSVGDILGVKGDSEPSGSGTWIPEPFVEEALD